MSNELKAVFKRGIPKNLPAAALDALEWMEWFNKYAKSHLVFSLPDSHKKLDRATRALKRQLKPHLPEQYEK